MTAETALALACCPDCNAVGKALDAALGPDTSNTDSLADDVADLARQRDEARDEIERLNAAHREAG